jgi:hypothetical protein
VKSLTKTAQSFAQVFLIAFAPGTRSVEPAIVNRSGEAISQIAGAGGVVAALVADVVLHARSGVDFGFNTFDRAAEALVIFASVFAISVAERVIDVFLRSVDS